MAEPHQAYLGKIISQTTAFVFFYFLFSPADAGSKWLNMLMALSRYINTL